MFQQVKSYAFERVEFSADIFPIFENAAQNLPDVKSTTGAIVVIVMLTL